MRQRRLVLAGLLGVIALVTVLLLRRVLSTVFLAITVAYVLSPVRRWIVRRGFGGRTAAAVATSLAFVAVVLVVLPLAIGLYSRRGLLFEFLRSIPPRFEVEAFGMVYTVDVATILEAIRDVASSLAVDLAGTTPVLGLKLFLFTLLVYGLLLQPGDVRRAAYRTVPPAYHDVLRTMHERVRDTLYGIYVLQGATAAGTFVIALVVFGLLGYDGVLVLSALAGLLQFVPVVGPSIVVAGLAATDLLADDVSRAVLVTVFGLVFVGFLPDALIRPKLASLTAGMPASLYFIGFTGGVLSLGLIGFIAGPLVVALLVETVQLLADERSTVQKRLG